MADLIFKQGSDSQVATFCECIRYLQTMYGFSCPVTAGTAPFQALKISVQTPVLLDKNTYPRP